MKIDRKALVGYASEDYFMAAANAIDVVASTLESVLHSMEPLVAKLVDHPDDSLHTFGMTLHQTMGEGVERLQHRWEGGP
jgi:hypothetical protein